MSETYKQDTKRIARNTMMLYIRMFITMGVSLYTSRIILQNLGIDDFGIYNVVGGVVVMLSFLNSSLSTTTQRFLNFEMGSGNAQRLRETFSTAFFIHLFIAVIVAIFAESIGIWFIHNKLTIPLERIDSAIAVFHCSVASIFFSIATAPYNAIIIAREKMNIYAIVSILDACFKVLIAIVIAYVTVDKLSIYGFMVMVVSMLSTSMYVAFSLWKFPESNIILIYDKGLIRQMFGFSGWMISGCLTNIFSTQGINMLINIYFGPALNAARAVALQVNSAITSFVTNFMTATKPQIVKMYACGEFTKMNKLVFLSSKFSFFLLWILILPVIINARYILELWLVEAPDFSVIFVQLILVDSLITSFYNPIATISQASGNIKNYQLIISGCFISVFLISWLLFELKFPVYFTFIILILIDIIGWIVRVVELDYSNNFPIKEYLKHVVYPAAKLVLTSLALVLPISYFLNVDSFGVLAMFTIACVMTVISLIWFVCTDSQEKQNIRTLIINKIAK